MGATTPEDAARAAAQELGWSTPADLLPDAFAAGAAWQRAQIAARRDKVAEALHADGCADDDCEGADMTDWDRQADIALAAALGVTR